jgi:DNA-binding NarL/FixJ family response regulator
MAPGVRFVTMSIVADQSEPGREGRTEGPHPACDRSPTVLVAIRHPVMRRWTCELLASEHGCWNVAQPAGDEMVVDAIARDRPALVIVDSADFPACCEAALRALPPGQVIVIGPEPDRAYRSRALALGAGGWVCRDHVGEELTAAMRAALGCRHCSCGPAASVPAPSQDSAPTGGHPQ